MTQTPYTGMEGVGRGSDEAPGPENGLELSGERKGPGHANAGHRAHRAELLPCARLRAESHTRMTAPRPRLTEEESEALRRYVVRPGSRSE